MNLIFLGAGASKPFGIPTMHEMVSQFEEELKSKHGELWHFYFEIKSKLSTTYGDRIDIESMLSVIDGISTSVKPSDLDHFISYYLESSGIKLGAFSDDMIKAARRSGQTTPTT